MNENRHGIDVLCFIGPVPQRYSAAVSTSTLREEKQVAKENQPAWQFASIGDERGCHTG